MMASSTEHAAACIPSLTSRSAITSGRRDGPSSSSSSNMEFMLLFGGGALSNIGVSMNRLWRTICVRAVGGGERVSGGGRVPLAMVLLGEDEILS